MAQITETGAEIGFRLDDLVQQLEDAPRSGPGAEFLIGVGAAAERIGDPFRLRELIDLVIAAAPADAEDPLRVSFTGAAGKPLNVEIAGVGALPPLADALLQRMDGQLRAPQRSLGPTIRLSLPFRAATAPEVAAPAPAPAPEVPASADPANLPFTGLRLLIADDSPTNLMVMQEMLAQTGATLTAVQDGLQALEAWQGGQFDLLLLDIAMPRMDGLTALQTIRAEEESSHRTETPAVAVTANAMPDQVAEYILGGFDTHLAKPFRRGELIGTIAALCGRDG